MKHQRQLYVPGGLDQLKAKRFTLSRLGSHIECLQLLPAPSHLCNVHCVQSTRVSICLSLCFYCLCTHMSDEAFCFFPKVFFFLIHDASDTFSLKMAVCTVCHSLVGLWICLEFIYIQLVKTNDQVIDSLHLWRCKGACLIWYWKLEERIFLS